MKRKYSPVRFSFLFPDLLIFNVIHWFLLTRMDVVINQEARFFMFFILFNNIAWLACSKVAGIYRYDKVWQVKEMLRHTLVAYLFFTLITWLFFDLNFLANAPTFLMLDVVWFGVFLLLSRLFLAIIMKMIDKAGLLKKHVVILGANQLSEILTNHLEKKSIFFEIKGFFDDNASSINGKYPLLGELNECLEYAKLNGVSEIYSTIAPEENSQLYQIAELAERNFIRFKFVPNIHKSAKYNYHFNFEEDIPVISLRPEPLSNFSGQVQKRFFDIIFSSLVIVFILSWLIPLLALLIKSESKGPVFFKQMRTGKNNSPFLCLKFRSLKVNDKADVLQVTRNDERFTRIGKFLRKTNLDELPQFFNVLFGDMSVVGSRPHMLKHTEDYSRLHSDYMIRHSIKPGLTGWAQVNGCRGEIKADEQLVNRVNHDIWYVENWNFWLDIRIVLQTVSTTIKGDKNAF